MLEAKNFHRVSLFPEFLLSKIFQQFLIFVMVDYKLTSICLRSEVLKCPDNLSKAVFILRSCLEKEVLKKHHLYSYFIISRESLVRSLWSELLGYTSEDVGNTKYLSPKYEQELAEKIEMKTSEHNSQSHGQVKTMVLNSNMISISISNIL